MADFEKILQGPQDTMTVMEALQRRQAARSEEHQQWLEDLTRSWSRHEQAMHKFEQTLQEIGQATRELDEKLGILADSQLTLTNTVNRFIESLQTQNGH